MLRFAPSLSLPLALVVLAGCAKTPETAVSDAKVQLPIVPGRPAVAYFTLTPATAGTLVSVQVAHFARAEMHESKMDGGAMTMTPVDTLPLAPGKPVVFAPAGLHVMLFDTDGAIKAGDTTDLTATLADGKKITTKAQVTGI